jgi:hypothetical protein
MVRSGDANDVALLQRIGRKTFEDTFGNTCTKEDMRGVLDLYFNAIQCEEELNDPADNFYFFEEHGFVNSGVENDFPLGSTPQTDYWFVKRLL